MSEIEVLNREIKGLKALLTGAWHDLASMSFTPYEYREKRNEMDRHSTELRDCLKALDTEHRRARAQFNSGTGATKPAARGLVTAR
jgi:chromosome segregation ATPase